MSDFKILIIDDNPLNIQILGETLEPHGFEIFAGSKASQTIKLAKTIAPDVIVLDVVMPGKDGFSICKLLKEEEEIREIPVLFISAKQETESVLQGFRMGAIDYISKPFRAEEVVIRIKTHARMSRLGRDLRERNRQLEAEIARRLEAEANRMEVSERLITISSQESQKWGVENLVGKSEALSKIRSEIQRLNKFSSTSVLVTGESGTGKELVARAIHYGGVRAQNPFVPVNCAAIPSELAESILFGHKKGAFTGAIADKKGCFEQANGGTLFLDEIGDMEMSLQAKLLRVLEDGEFFPVGSNTSRKADVRVVAATNADLPSRISLGKFRQDLYFRIARYTIQTVPLRERPEDIPMMAVHFLAVLASEMGMIVPELSEEAMKMLTEHAFPGNVRELKNVIERALIESGGKTILSHHIHLTYATPLLNKQEEEVPTKAKTLNAREAEEELIRRAIDSTHGNLSEAAKKLGMHRSRLYRFLDRMK